MAPYRLLVLVTLLCLVPVHALALTDEPPTARPDPITITEVKVRVSDHGPVVLLQAEGRTIPIFVDVTVALSIQGVLNGEQLPRPMSHDLMRAILEAYGGKVTQTVITLRGGVYFGALTVSLNDQVKVFDSRSSDSIALAIHFNAPILVGRDLLESAGKVPEKEKETEL
ncbi:MAG: bifunctional nuclease family protein [Nitrospira sp.]|jgi:bifunctional DNase/RNase|nr:bifunctional nuclease family protein [Nitrospira sp. BO4]